MIKDLVQPNDPILRKPTEKIDFTNPQINPVELYKDLAESLVQYRGLGLSANQIGYPYQAFVIWMDPIKIFINPVIVDVSENLVELEEGCLSFPGIFVKVKRPQVVKIRYWDPVGEVHTNKYQDMTARVIQHEMDHLNGELFTRNCTNLQLSLAITKAKKKKRAYRIGDLR